MRDREKKTESYFVYLLLCEDGSYYTGYTSDLTSRLERHKKGYGARYTRMRKATAVVYIEEFRTRRAAMRREREMKALTHNEKLKLAESQHRLSKKTKAKRKPKRPQLPRRASSVIIAARR